MRRVHTCEISVSIGTRKLKKRAFHLSNAYLTSMNQAEGKDNQPS